MKWHCYNEMILNEILWFEDLLHLYLTVTKFYAKPTLPICIYYLLPTCTMRQMTCHSHSACFLHDFFMKHWPSLPPPNRHTDLAFLLRCQDAVPVSILCHKALSSPHTHSAVWIRSSICNHLYQNTTWHQYWSNAIICLLLPVDS